jgi:hypothetical protein
MSASLSWSNLNLPSAPLSISTNAYLLADKAKTPLKVTKNDEGVDIALPEGERNPIATSGTRDRLTLSQLTAQCLLVMLRELDLCKEFHCSRMVDVL